MNLTKLFDMQRVLDQRIIDKHPELKDQNNLEWKVLALQVELGECANEWRGFKKWSNDQKPRLLASRQTANMREPEFYNPLLEEYVDCLHFILSIGLEFPLQSENLMVYDRFNKKRDITQQFNEVFLTIGDLQLNIHLDKSRATLDRYEDMFIEFILLGEKIGFTWEQIEQAYLDKNKVNHERQESGY